MSDAAGRPVAGATAEAISASPFCRATTRVRTDAAGAFAMDVEGEGPYDLLVEPQFPHLRTLRTAVVAGATLSVVLPSSSIVIYRLTCGGAKVAHVGGRVLFDEGVGAAGPHQSSPRWASIRSVRADEQGAVAVPFDATMSVATLEMDGFERISIARPTAEAPSTELTALRLSRSPVRDLFLRVVDDVDRAPVAGVEVDAAAFAEIETGLYRGTVQGMRRRIEVRAGGYARTWIRVAKGEGVDRGQPVIAKLSRLQSICGHVVDADGQGVARAAVYANYQELIGEDGNGGAPESRGLSDGSGHFELTGLDPKRAYRICVRADGIALTVSHRAFTVGQPALIAVNRVPAHCWRLRRTPGGEPVAGGVLITDEDAGGEIRQACLSTLDGNVRVDQTSFAPYYWAWGEGVVPRAITLAEVAANDGAVLLASGAARRLTAVDSNGRPIAGRAVAWCARPTVGSIPGAGAWSVDLPGAVAWTDATGAVSVLTPPGDSLVSACRLGLFADWGRAWAIGHWSTVTIRPDGVDGR